MLKTGDILVFKAGDDWIGKSIAWITKSDVSHAAMVYGEDEIVEMGLNGISVSKISYHQGNSAHVMRMTSECNPQPLLDAAKVYVDAETRYDFPALVILAGLLIYNEIHPTQKYVNISDMIIRYACKELDKLIQKLILKNPDKALVCSQLVYQVYHDCGGDYRIHFDKGTFQSNDSMPNDNDEGTRLIDLVMTESANIDMSLPNEELLPEIEPEELAEQLYQAMVEPIEQTELYSNELDTMDTGSLSQSVTRFLDLVEQFLEKSKSDIDIDGLFVTPADLSYHARNLHQVDMLDIKRIH